MSHLSLSPRVWGVIMGCAAVLTIGGLTRAEDDVVEDDQPQGKVLIRQARVMFPDQILDQWVFGNARTFKQNRWRFENDLNLRIENLSQTCQLTAEQKQKLRLAGEGDIKRFLERYEKVHENFKKVQNDQNKIGEIFQETQPLQQTFKAGLFSENSIFTKSIIKTLDESQSAKYLEKERERRHFRYRAKIELVATTLDNAIGLSAKQRNQFVKLLLDETQPPLKFGQWDYYAVLFQASELPEAKLKAIFDDAQWNVLKKQLQQARGMETVLKSGKFIADRNSKAGETATVTTKARRVDR